MCPGGVHGLEAEDGLNSVCQGRQPPKGVRQGGEERAEGETAGLRDIDKAERWGERHRNGGLEQEKQEGK